MRPALNRYLKLERELTSVSLAARADKVISLEEEGLLWQALGCPFCARESKARYNFACDRIAAVLKENGFELSMITERLNERYQEANHGDVVAVLDEDGNRIDFVNRCTNGIFDILEIAAELIK